MDVSDADPGCDDVDAAGAHARATDRTERALAARPNPWTEWTNDLIETLEGGAA